MRRLDIFRQGLRPGYPRRSSSPDATSRRVSSAAKYLVDLWLTRPSWRSQHFGLRSVSSNADYNVPLHRDRLQHRRCDRQALGQCYNVNDLSAAATTLSNSAESDNIFAVTEMQVSPWLALEASELRTHLFDTVSRLRKGPGGHKRCLQNKLTDEIVP